MFFLVLSPSSTAVIGLACHIHTGRRPCPYVYFPVRDILFCRRLIPIDSSDDKRTSTRGPEAKHLRPRRTPTDRVFAAWRLSFKSSLSANVCMHCCRTFFVGNAHASLTCRSPNRENCMNEIFHAGLEPLCAFVCSYTGYCKLLDSAVTLWTRYWVTQWELVWIKLNCVVRSCAAHNTTRVFEQRSIFNPACAVHDTASHVPTAPLSPLMLTTRATPYFLRASNPSANFCARLFKLAETLSLLARFWPSEDHLSQTTLAHSFLREITVPPSLENFITVWSPGEFC